MSYGLSTASVHAGFQGLEGLRREAQAPSEDTLRKVAQQFEALFIQMMLKNMREASFGDELFDSDQVKFYREMFDQQLSVHMAGQRGGLGLADMMVRQLGGRISSAPAEDNARPEGPAPHAMAAQGMPRMTAKSASVDHAPATKAQGGFRLRAMEGRSEFVAALRPLAEAAGRRLGVPPEALLAQSALETGWGGRMIAHADGRNSHNLFGIKADGRWTGDRVAVTTVEYEDGLAVRKQETFRAYASFAESFEDYVDFLQTNPRYARALAQAGDGRGFVAELHAAGYATDPAYAHKVNGILDSMTLSGGPEGVQGSSDEAAIQRRDG